MENDYVNFLKYIYKNMAQNSFHEISDEDVKLFQKNEYILKELADICRGGNTRDPRVLAYCQPVFNVKTGRYDTAEALMRLKLPEIGLVFPDQFISLAEENGFIHVLTEIMLQKTCDELRYLIAEGYEVSRISVNVSVSELREENFIDDVGRIIEGSNIPYEKVAIELTESMNESDFAIMKNKIDELKEKGIKFYLDDFGTGYSNFERIMEIPFDIIKFDRSMLIESNRSESGEFMVKTFAGMFKKLNYSVLFEGVEDDLDEQHCIGMQASYLQGYKYSRPIPIENLRDFLTRTA
jgi:EAL domain-containing protein (putative c-di-GMP-specific phosphodiesterase class I)